MYRLMGLVGPRSAAFVCGADSTTVLRVWVGRPENHLSGSFDKTASVKFLAFFAGVVFLFVWWYTFGMSNFKENSVESNKATV